VGSSGADSLGTFTYNTSVLNSHTDMKWETQSVVFVATSSTEILKFQSNTEGPYTTESQPMARRWTRYPWFRFRCRPRRGWGSPCWAGWVVGGIAEKIRSRARIA